MGRGKTVPSLGTLLPDYGVQPAADRARRDFPEPTGANGGLWLTPNTSHPKLSLAASHRSCLGPSNKSDGVSVLNVSPEGDGQATP